MASAFVGRAFERYEGGNIKAAQADWSAAKSYLASAPYEAFGDVAEKVQEAGPIPGRAQGVDLLADTDQARRVGRLPRRLGEQQGEHATDPLTGSVDGTGIFRSLVAHCSETARMTPAA